MSFDINACKKKFEDLSGNIQWVEVIDDGIKETFRIFVRDLIGSKVDYDKILNEDILPHFPVLNTYSFEQYTNQGTVFGVTCIKNIN